MSGLHLGGQFISYEKLPELNIPESSPFNQALKFCKAYSSQQQEFPIKTSGSTGTPKLMVLKRDQLKTSALMTIEALGLQSNYNGLVCISTSHIGGKMMLVRGMELGMELYLVEPSAKVKLQDLPVIDFVALVPLQIQALLGSAAGLNFLNGCQAIIVGGGQINKSLEARLDQVQCPVYQTFGMTETVSHIALRRLNGPQSNRYYHAFDQVNLSLDERGCLVVTGALTNHVPVMTNDLVEMMGQNEFRWLGRYDRVINTGGYKVIPEQLDPVISTCLNASGVQADFVIIGLPHTKWGQQVTLILEGDRLDHEFEERLLKQLKESLHPYQVPKAIAYLKKLPRSATGKVDIPEITKLLL